MAAHQAPLSLGFSREEHWSGLPFPSPMCESEVPQSCPTHSDPMDCSLPGSSIHEIFQQEYWSRLPLQSQTLYCMSYFYKSRNYLKNGESIPMVSAEKNIELVLHFTQFPKESNYSAPIFLPVSFN